MRSLRPYQHEDASRLVANGDQVDSDTVEHWKMSPRIHARLR